MWCCPQAISCSRSRATLQQNNIYWYDTSADNASLLINGDDIGIDGGGSGEPIVGLELAESGATVGGVSLSTGDILVTHQYRRYGR